MCIRDSYKVAKSFTDTVKEKALGQNVLTAVKPSQLMVKIVHDEGELHPKQRPFSDNADPAAAQRQ